MKKINWFKLSLLALVLFLFVGLLAACNGDNDDDDDPADNGDETYEETPDEDDDDDDEDIADDDDDEDVPADQVTIRLGTWESGSGYDMTREIADSFMDQNPGIEIIIESVPDGFGERLITQLAAGEAPDLFQIGDGDVAAFQSRGAFADLTPFINGDIPLNIDDFYDPMLDIGRIGDGIYTLPKDFSTLAVYYNIDMFEAAGIDLPTADWTWDEFREIAAELTTDDVWGAQLIGGLRWALPIIYSYGGDVISADGQTVEGYMDSPETIAALEFLDELINVDESMPSQSAVEAFEGVNLFLSENVAMLISGIWPANSFIEEDMNFGTVMLPGGPVTQAGTIAYAGYGMWADSPNHAEAWAFLQYLVTEGQHVLANHALTAYRPAAESTGQLDWPHAGAFIDSVDIMRMFPERLNPFFGGTAGREITAVLDDINLGLATDIASMLEEAAERGQADLEEEMAFQD